MYTPANLSQIACGVTAARHDTARYAPAVTRADFPRTLCTRPLGHEGSHADTLAGLAWVDGEPWSPPTATRLAVEEV